MQDYIDREIEQLPQETIPEDPNVTTVRNTLFVRMLILSLLIHLALTPLAVLPGKRSGGIPFSSMIAVDLDSVPSFPEQPPQEDPVPRLTEAVPEEPVTPPLPEQEAVPKAPLTDVERLTEHVREAVAGGKDQPELLEQSSLGLGLSLGYFSSLAEGRTLRDDIKQYYFAMLRKVNEQWWLTGAGSIRTPRIPIITVVLARNGDLVERFIAQGSGDREYDKKILQAVDSAAPFPPLPPTYRDPFFKVPIRMVAPLNFLLPGATPAPQGHS
jgi:protein TonB